MWLFLRPSLLALILSVWPIDSTTRLSRSKSALCFLTTWPANETIDFALELADRATFIDVFIIVDDNSTQPLPVLQSTAVEFLTFNDSVCTTSGFFKSNQLESKQGCLAWDKALYFFTNVARDYSFVWFVESDVFIPSVQAFISLHELYSPSNDLITADNVHNVDGRLEDWPHWYLALDTLPLPWAKSMVCAMGCSRRLLSVVEEYARRHGHIVYIELIFHTLALQHPEMKVVTPAELSTVVYRTDYAWEHITARPFNIWHPVKDLKQQPTWRRW